MQRYHIIRNYALKPNRNEIIKRGLTLQEAQAWCRDPETSSRTATSPEAVRRTQERGPWFDGYSPTC